MSIHTDYGTEVGLNRVLPWEVGRVLPYMHTDSTQKPDTQVQGDDDLFCSALEGVATQEEDMFLDPVSANSDQILMDLTGSLEGPDMMHIIRNVTNGLGSVVDFYDGFLAQLKAVSKLLSTRATKRQLLQTCFSWTEAGDAAAPGFQADIKAFKVSAREERWNTKACAIESLAELEVPLKSCWSLAKFLGRQTQTLLALSMDRVRRMVSASVLLMKPSLQSSFGGLCV